MRLPIACLAVLLFALPALAQGGAKPRMGPPKPSFAPTQPVPQEKVEADISTRTLEVTTGFTGQEIVVFGAIDNSQAPKEETGYYDVVVVVEGTPFPMVVRRKSDVAGVWINTESVTFSAVPSYYAIASTRPIEKIAGPPVLERHAVGMRHIKMTPSTRYKTDLKEYEIAAFRDAVIRIKKREKLYVLEPNGVTFAGRSLFRATIPLPANVPVGPLVARTYLFRNGEVVSAHIGRVVLHRIGIERLVHNFAFVHPISYGILAVLLAIGSGLAASAYFRRRPG